MAVIPLGRIFGLSPQLFHFEPRAFDFLWLILPLPDALLPYTSPFCALYLFSFIPTYALSTSVHLYTDCSKLLGLGDQPDPFKPFSLLLHTVQPNAHLSLSLFFPFIQLSFSPFRSILPLPSLLASCTF